MLPLQRVQVQPLVGKLTSLMPTEKTNIVLSSEHSYSGSCASLNVLKSEFRVDVSVSFLLWGNTSAQYSSLWEVEYDVLCGLLR